MVETSGKKKRKVEPLTVISRFPGGGFAARMKKLMERKSNCGSKMPVGVSKSASWLTEASRKKGAATEGSNAKCAKKLSRENIQSKTSGVISVALNKEEEVDIEDFDSQELLQSAPVRPGGDSGAVKSNRGKLESSKGKENSLEEMRICLKIDGQLAGAGSSKTRPA